MEKIGNKKNIKINVAESYNMYLHGAMLRAGGMMINIDVDINSFYNTIITGGFDKFFTFEAFIYKQKTGILELYNCEILDDKIFQTGWITCEE